MRTKDEYVKQLDQMVVRLRQWAQANPLCDFKIQYNYSNNACVIAGLKEAMDDGFVSADEEGKRMFRECGWLDDVPSMPTILMVRVVIETVFGDGATNKN